MAVGHEIKRLRELAGLSLKDLATQTGLALGYLYSIESGSDVPSHYAIHEIKECLQKSGVAEAELSGLRLPRFAAPEPQPSAQEPSSSLVTSLLVLPPFVLFLVGSIGWVANGLMVVGAGLGAAIAWGVAFVLLLPTGIGGGLLSVFVGRAYELPDTALFVRTLVGYVVGVLAGGVIGLPLGFLLAGGVALVRKAFKTVKTTPQGS
jgi:transcriptional regulator with XRE-family HTH domain